MRPRPPRSEIGDSASTPECRSGRILKASWLWLSLTEFGGSKWSVGPPPGPRMSRTGRPAPPHRSPAGTPVLPSRPPLRWPGSGESAGQIDPEPVRQPGRQRADDHGVELRLCQEFPCACDRVMVDDLALRAGPELPEPVELVLQSARRQGMRDLLGAPVTHVKMRA